ncbi:MAG TPA: hypothetical protein VHB02_19175 [Acidimicrobiales bacterium]|nr:hypothetical protein [Acidimicrobiales bacterium]
MAVLRAHGIEAALPAGFGGRIFMRKPVGGEVTRPVAHFATVPLPAGAGDFGGGVVTALGPTDVFAVLFEYGPESVGKALFARQGRPGRLGPEHFRPTVLRRGLAEQSGTQWFFTEAGRPFTFYAVLGSHGRRGVLAPRVDRLLSSVVLHPMAAAVAGDPWN